MTRHLPMQEQVDDRAPGLFEYHRQEQRGKELPTTCVLGWTSLQDMKQTGVRREVGPSRMGTRLLLAHTKAW